MHGGRSRLDLDAVELEVACERRQADQVIVELEQCFGEAPKLSGSEPARSLDGGQRDPLDVLEPVGIGYLRILLLKKTIS